MYAQSHYRPLTPFRSLLQTPLLSYSPSQPQEPEKKAEQKKFESELEAEMQSLQHTVRIRFYYICMFDEQACLELLDLQHSKDKFITVSTSSLLNVRQGTRSVWMILSQ